MTKLGQIPRAPLKMFCWGLITFLLLLFPTVISFSSEVGSDSIVSRERVFFLHGLGRTSASMFLLKHRLEKQGYEVISNSYTSTDAGIDEHVMWLDEQLSLCCHDDSTHLHFVTHSLGGIVLRVYLKNHEVANLGRVVMLAPPSQGSELADFLKNWEVYRMTAGPSGQEIGTDDDSVPKLLGPVDFELGVIAGMRSLNPFYSSIIPGPDDGKVSVERARVEGMSDFILVDHSHTFIMNASDVAAQVFAFLRRGAFEHDTADADSTELEEAKHDH